MTPCFDKLGQEIVVGSYIAYGHALGRCAGLRVGRVDRIVQKDDTYRMGWQWAITVTHVDDDWSHTPPTLGNRRGTLMFPNRMIVLAPELVPATYRALLGEKNGG